MNTMTNSDWCKGAILAVALAATPIALAGPSAASPEMRTALAKAAEGPDQLRQYVQRTRAIYALDFNEVMDRHEAIKAAAVANTPQVAVSATK